jgi:hypothetical protein
VVESIPEGGFGEKKWEGGERRSAGKNSRNESPARPLYL